MDNEKLMAMLEKVLKRLDLVTIAALMIILCTIGYLVLISEGSFILPPQEKPGKQEFTDAVAGQPFYPQLQSQYPDSTVPLQEVPELRVLVQNDMFSLKALKAAEEARKGLNEEYKKAEAAFVAQRLTEAEAIIDAILQKDASHPEARDLKKRLQEAKAPTPSPTPAE